ncbi:MAG: hypothetical protein ACXWL5_03330 [Candidatus Chromulinivorax sp.]
MTYNFLKKIIACNCLLILNLHGMDKTKKLLDEKDWLKKSIEATQWTIDTEGREAGAADPAIRDHLPLFLKDQKDFLEQQTSKLRKVQEALNNVAQNTAEKISSDINQTKHDEQQKIEAEIKRIEKEMRYSHTQAAYEIMEADPAARECRDELLREAEKQEAAAQEKGKEQRAKLTRDFQNVGNQMDNAVKLKAAVAERIRNQA